MYIYVLTVPTRVCCSTLQHTATHALQHTLQHTVTYLWSRLLRNVDTVPTRICCNTLQRTATLCNTLQHTATHCNTLQHTATHSADSLIARHKRRKKYIVLKSSTFPYIHVNFKYIYMSLLNMYRSLLNGYRCSCARHHSARGEWPFEHHPPAVGQSYLASVHSVGICMYVYICIYICI